MQKNPDFCIGLEDWLIRIQRSSIGATCEFEAGFVWCADFECEELGVPETIGLALNDSDSGVGSFVRSGGYSVVVEVADLVAMRDQGNVVLTWRQSRISNPWYNKLVHML